MIYTIKNPTENMNGNSKENIFIAYDGEGNALGNAYVYPAINHYQTYETPQMIYFDVMVGIETEDICQNTLQNDLYDCVLKRAKELRKERSELTTRFYTGLMNDPERLACLLEKGFDEDCTIIMSLDDFEKISDLDQTVRAKRLALDSQEELEAYENIYNELFITPLDRDMLVEMQKNEAFECAYITYKDQAIGGYTIYVEEGIGYIETLYVLPEKINKGYGHMVMTYALKQLKLAGVSSIELEVWQINKRAIKLYESYGFKKIASNIMFPGIEL